MLLFSPEYAPHFPEVTAALLAGNSGETALTSVYRKPLDAITRDTRAWTERHSFTPIRLPAVLPPFDAVLVRPVPQFESRMLLADLLSASGALDRAAECYRQLDQETPNSAAILAARGVVALRQGQNGQAMRFFQRSIELGVGDAFVCYRFAQLADAAGLPVDAIRAALQRALELDPGFDDAHYTIALIEANAGRYEPALSHLSAMQTVRPDRAHAYWSARANALIELGRSEEAVEASQRAARYAATNEERVHANQLSYIARTDITVQFSKDANGRPQLVTTRVPHDTVDRNPFIEPADHIRRIEARLMNVDCSGNGLTVSVEADGAKLKLRSPTPRTSRCGAPPLSSPAAPNRRILSR